MLLLDVGDCWSMSLDRIACERSAFDPNGNVFENEELLLLVFRLVGFVPGDLRVKSGHLRG
jgi:hypothetical protein